ncbi:MAG: hypothetical protein ACRC2T_10900 [Thermoguttaceae bacterium]
MQIDHCIPYEVAGETDNDHMLLCASCNRAKSWSCEHCDNWITERNGTTCRSCYWANPKQYSHVALCQIRRLDLTWTEDEVAVYDKLTLESNQAKITVPDFVKRILEKHVDFKKPEKNKFSAGFDAGS